VNAEAKETQALLVSPEVQRAIKEAAALAAAAAVAAVMKAVRGEGVTTSAATEQLAVGIIRVPRNKLFFDTDHDAGVARIVGVPPELEHAGVHDGFELCELDGEPGYQIVHRLHRGERAVRFGVPIVVKFRNESEIATLQLLLTDAIAEAPREPPPRRGIDDSSPFGPKSWPNMPAEDASFYESSSRRPVSYSAVPPGYDPFRMGNYDPFSNEAWFNPFNLPVTPPGQ
jgi:hypothetical protein